MPLYEYECTSCLKRTEVHRSMDDRKRPTPCGSCGATATLVISATSAPVIGPGRSSESRQDHATRNRARLLKRSQDWDKSPAGRAQRTASIRRVYYGER